MGTGCLIALSNSLISQAIQEVREGKHEFLHIDCNGPALTSGDVFWPFLLGVVSVLKRVTMDWLVKPMREVCLDKRLLLILCMQAVSLFSSTSSTVTRPRPFSSL